MKKSQGLFILFATAISILLTYLFIDAPLADLAVYLGAGSTLSAGQNPYSAPFTIEFGPDRLTLFYLYPPPLAAILRWAEPFENTVIRALWLTCSVLAVAGGSCALAHTIEGVRCAWRTSTLLFLLVAFSPPHLEGLYFGQVHGFVYALVCIGAYGFCNRRGGMAGTAIATALSLKLTPALLIVPLVRARMWRAFLSLGAVILCALVIGASTPRSITAWADFLGSATSTLQSSRLKDNQENYSPVKLLAGLMQLSDPESLAALATEIAAFGCLSLLFVPFVPERRTDLRRLYGLSVLVFVFSSPIVWFHHLIWMTPAFVFAWQVRGSIGRSLLGIAAATAGISMYMDVYFRAIMGGGPIGSICILGPLSILLLCLCLPPKKGPKIEPVIE